MRPGITDTTRIRFGYESDTQCRFVDNKPDRADKRKTGNNKRSTWPTRWLWQFNLIAAEAEANGLDKIDKQKGCSSLSLFSFVLSLSLSLPRLPFFPSEWGVRANRRSNKSHSAKCSGAGRAEVERGEMTQNSSLCMCICLCVCVPGCATMNANVHVDWIGSRASATTYYNGMDHLSQRLY